MIHDTKLYLVVRLEFSLFIAIIPRSTDLECLYLLEFLWLVKKVWLKIICIW